MDINSIRDVYGGVCFDHSHSVGHRAVGAWMGVILHRRRGLLNN